MIFLILDLDLDDNCYLHTDITAMGVGALQLFLSIDTERRRGRPSIDTERRRCRPLCSGKKNTKKTREI